jgi:hypothetical protein
MRSWSLSNAVGSTDGREGGKNKEALNWKGAEGAAEAEVCMRREESGAASDFNILECRDCISICSSMR